MRDGTRVSVSCSHCDVSRESSRLPRGWKNHEGIYCGKCWRALYILRALTVPVVSPLDCDWRTLWESLSTVWKVTTQASNWMMTELYRLDAERQGDEKMPPMEHLYFYPEIGRRWPQLPPRSRTSLEQSIKGKYRAVRYKLKWQHGVSLPSFRYPVPYPVHNQGWKASIENESPVVSVEVAPKQRLRLRLKGGPRYHRQRRAFDQIVSGEAIQGELSLCRRTNPESKLPEVSCKMVAWFPRPENAGEKHGTLYVHTHEDHLLTALNIKDERLWTYNGDHLPRWTMEHKQRLQRWADDSKFENQPTPTFSKRRTAAVAKYHNRMDSACHEIAAQLAGYAERRKFGVVEYNDSEQGFCVTFPWYKLRALIAEKLDARGIQFSLSSIKESNK